MDKAWVEMSPKEQDAAFAELVQRLPVGTKVVILSSDDETVDLYRGKRGTVRWHSRGDDPPLVSVAFDEPIGKIDGDGFYEDEIEVIGGKTP